MSAPTTEQQERWTLFHTAVMKLAKDSGFDGCIVGAFLLSTYDETLGGRLFSATASNGDIGQDVIRAIHVAMAQRLVGLTDNDLDGYRPLAEA
jgi:hypothetical protein